MPAKSLVIAAVLLSCSFNASATAAPSYQQGSKLVGTGAVGAAGQGASVALSANGNTAIVGGYQDNGGAGAAWVFTRSGGVWSQQGSKLVGTGAVGLANQGISVSLSADGNTAIVGGNNDHGGAGAAWVYTRSGGVWNQQGAKLVGTGAVGTVVYQGTSVALSGDGNTAIVGGPEDNHQAGAAWMYTRSGGIWSQQGAKLVGIGGLGAAQLGFSVALSADTTLVARGNIAMVGGPLDNSGGSGNGAAWMFTQGSGMWGQQGDRLAGTGAVEPAYQGTSVALSADGSTGIVGGSNDNSGVGAVWAYRGNGVTWSQPGLKLVGTGAGGSANQGTSVALSADGNTAMVGGYNDNSGAGAAWVYTQSGNAIWSQQGLKLVGTGAVGNANQGSSIALSGDGNTAIVGGYQDNSGAGAAWVFIDPAILAGSPPPVLPTALQLAPPFPNPSTSEITVSFSLPRDADVTLGVYDIAGRSVRTLVSGAAVAGEHTIGWDGRTLASQSAQSGIYFLALRVGGDQLTRRFVLLR